MTRRAAIITQADVARAIRAAKHACAATVEVRPEGTIIVRVDAPPIVPTDKFLDEEQIIPLC